jgi:hypothetical protein
VKICAAKLERLIEEAIVDAYTEAEQVTDFLTAIQDDLARPFVTSVPGVAVEVERIDLNDADEIVDICRRGRMRQAVPILSLPLPKPAPKGAQWIEAYCRWVRRR